MRFVRPVGFLFVVALALSGCGSGNKAKAEKLMDESVAEMEKVIAAFERGDKAGVNAAIDRVIAITQQSKGLRVSKSENEALKKRSQEKMAGMAQRMADAMKGAMASGKYSPADLQDLGQKMRDASAAMK